MIRYLSFLPAFLFFINLSSQTPFIHLDQFGYYTEASKVAVLSDPQIGFNSNESYEPGHIIELRRADDQSVIFSGSPIIWNGGATDDLSGDRGWWFDFTEVTEEGTYYIFDPSNNITSPTFSISNNPYLEVLKASTKMFYYNRCNMAKEQPYAEAKWTDGMNFDKPLQDFNCRYIYDRDNAALEKDLSGGWFDAGDYNKYVSFTHTTLHNLLAAYEANPGLFTDDWNWPESGNGLPDLLDEVKWELDWLLKMSNIDGSVHNKMGSQNYNENTASPPSANTDQRFYGPTCTSASVTVASIFAHAAIVFDQFPSYQTYANELASQAIACFEYVQPFINSNTLETDCDDGSIVAGDADLNVDQQIDFLVSAAIYLKEWTDNNAYDSFIETYVYNTEPVANNFWGPYKLPLTDALLRYTEFSSADSNIKDAILDAASQDVSNDWNNYFGIDESSLYRSNMPSWSFHWGSTSPKAGYGVINQSMATYGIGDDAENQHQKAEELLHSFHGVNPLGVVQLSNMYSLGASRSVNEIYHTWFYNGTDYDNAITSLYGPAPGFVTGGPNASFSVDWLSPPSNQPAQKSYLDFNTGWPESSWEISEPAIYYQAVYVRLLSQVIGNRGFSNPTNTEELIPQVFRLMPNPTSDQFMIQGNFEFSYIQIRGIDGQLLQEINAVQPNERIDIADLPKGVYLVTVDNKTGKRHNHRLIKL